MKDLIHVLEFVARAPSLTLSEFAARWQQVNASLIADDRTVLQCSVVSRLAQDGPARADGVVELWFESREDYARFQQRRATDGTTRTALASLLAGPPGPCLVTRDRVIFHRRPIAADDELIKLFYVIKRAEGQSLEHFSRYYEHVHTLYSAKPPFQRNYVQAHRLPGEDEPGFDGVSCIWFADRAGLDGYLASKELEQGIVDGQRFLDLSAFFSIAGVESRLRWAGLPVARAD